MKVLQINIFGNLSTGRIAVDLYRTLKDNNHDGMVAYSRNTIASDVPSIKFGNKWNIYFDGIMTRLTDKAGLFSQKATYNLINQIEAYDPDIIHLHNLHGYYINIELLFDFIKKSNKKVVWTLHDCWSFTGHCCNFEVSGCEKWKTGCRECPNLKAYPASLFDNSFWNYNKKKELFTAVKNMTLVTPSNWLAGLVYQSYMRDFETVVIHNGVDLNTFKPTYGTWREDHNLGNKKVVLGVAGTWTPTKGLDDIIQLSEMLDDSYAVVVVGVSEKQLRKLPKSVLGIKRTYDSRELAEIYTAACFFVNLTYDDNFPNVNIEALGCGTPVLTYKTGGSPEAIDDTCGSVVEKGNVVDLAKIIQTAEFSKDACIKRAELFTRDKSYLEYIDVYNKILSR